MIQYKASDLQIALSKPLCVYSGTFQTKCWDKNSLFGRSPNLRGLSHWSVKCSLIGVYSEGYRLAEVGNDSLRNSALNSPEKANIVRHHSCYTDCWQSPGRQRANRPQDFVPAYTYSLLWLGMSWIKSPHMTFNHSWGHLLPSCTCKDMQERRWSLSI